MGFTVSSQTNHFFNLEEKTLFYDNFIDKLSKK